MADGTLEPIPEGLDDAGDERPLPLSDVFTTAYHAVTGADITEGDVCSSSATEPRDSSPRARRHLHTVTTRDGDGLADLLGDLTDGLGPTRSRRGIERRVERREAS